MKHYMKASLFFVVGFVTQLVFIITGILVHALLCNWYKERPSEREPFTKYEGMWRSVHLPWLKALWLWDNERDGLYGDKRGFYTTQYNPHWSTKLKCFWWGAIRNPANNFKRFVLGCDIREFSMKTLYGKDFVRDDFDSTGFQLVKAERVSGKGIDHYHLYWVKRWGKSNRAIVVELGNKVQARHNGATYEEESKYFKGFTFEVNPFKDIS